MSEPMLERRPRILVIEDIDVMRESYVDNLEIDDQYYVDSVANLSDAFAAVRQRTYHVALVDIMLAGEKDIANRDGVRVLEEIRAQGEGTRCIVLTAQRETQLVRDFLRDLDAFDYVDKGIVGAKGFSAVSGAIGEALTKSPVDREISWPELVEVLAGGVYEQRFVSDLMSRLTFKGGFENLSRSLVSVATHLMPLKPLISGSTGLVLNESSATSSGTFWSKGQGCAVSITVCGTASDIGSVGPALVEKEKSGLRIVVSALPSHVRDEFA